MPPSPPAALDRTDTTHLSAHLHQCVRGPLHRVQCLAEALHAFLAPRFVTTLGLTTVVALVGLSVPV